MHRRKPYLPAAAAGLAVFAASGNALAQDGPWGYHMMGGGWFMGPIMMLLFLAIVVAAVVFVVRWLSPPHGPGRGNGKSAIAILEERYARGDIERDEFEERKRVIEG